MHSLNFYYNGKNSSDLGIYMVSLESGLKKVPFLSDREIISESIPNNPIPYVYGTRYSPLKFSIVLSLLDGEWTFEKRQEIARWLDVETFEEFYTEENPDRKYYFMYQGGVPLSYDAEIKGYIEIEMLNISPYSYSKYYLNEFDCTISPSSISIVNNGDMSIFPEVEIFKYGNGDVSIMNSTNGKEFKFTGLNDQETVYIDNLNHYIESDIPLQSRYDSFNLNYLELVRGINKLTVTGSCKLTFRYQLQYKG